ncbi:MAG: hypothetical protein JXQ87_19145 [Bacteroidia bacterium]
MSRTKYSFKLDGYDYSWSEPSLYNRKKYSQLPTGKYSLKVMAINGTQKFDTAQYDFEIKAPWWITTWALIAWSIIIILQIGIFIRIRTSHLRRRQHLLENEIAVATKEITLEKEKSDNLLLNILPTQVAEELKETGESEAQHFDQVSILFTDFKEFTQTAEKLSPKELVNEINTCFKAFDNICEKYGIEKIKTIGDSYMAASGLGRSSKEKVQGLKDAANLVLAALEMQEFMTTLNFKPETLNFSMRAGIHTGPVVAGIVGVKKFQYDIWGDTVNIASRMESHGEVGKVNISEATYNILKSDIGLSFTERQMIDIKGKGQMRTYFVSQIKEAKN